MKNTCDWRIEVALVVMATVLEMNWFKEGTSQVCSGVSGVTILLSLSVFSLMIADALPQTSEAIPLLGQHTMHIT